MMKTQKWEELDVRLSEPILKMLKQLRFFNMTPVQVYRMYLYSTGKNMLAYVELYKCVCVFSIMTQHLYCILYHCIVGSMYTIIIEW